jgi:hypothetical protein
MDPADVNTAIIKIIHYYFGPAPFGVIQALATDQTQAPPITIS